MATNNGDTTSKCMGGDCVVEQIRMRELEEPQQHQQRYLWEHDNMGGKTHRAISKPIGVTIIIQEATTHNFQSKDNIATPTMMKFLGWNWKTYPWYTREFIANLFMMQVSPQQNQLQAGKTHDMVYLAENTFVIISRKSLPLNEECNP